LWCRLTVNLDAFAERWVRTMKTECLSKLILFGETSLRRILHELLKHYHHELTTKAKTISCSSVPLLRSRPKIDLGFHCHHRLGVRGIPTPR